MVLGGGDRLVEEPLCFAELLLVLRNERLIVIGRILFRLQLDGFVKIATRSKETIASVDVQECTNNGLKIGRQRTQGQRTQQGNGRIGMPALTQSELCLVDKDSVVGLTIRVQLQGSAKIILGSLEIVELAVGDGA